ncbi:MAG TPA: septum formation initiator family protein [Vicinamibacterales bacterium]
MPPKPGGSGVRHSAPPGLVRPGWTRRLVRPGLVLVVLILVADALVGDNGLFEHRRELRRHEAVRKELEETQRRNHELRERARRLREKDPRTIEDLARRNLGMIKPGEVLFIVKDLEPPAEDRTPQTRQSR